MQGEHGAACPHGRASSLPAETLVLFEAIQECQTALRISASLYEVKWDKMKPFSREVHRMDGKKSNNQRFEDQKIRTAWDPSRRSGTSLW